MSSLINRTKPSAFAIPKFLSPANLKRHSFVSFKQSRKGTTSAASATTTKQNVDPVDTVNVKINGRQVKVPSTLTILEACQYLNEKKIHQVPEIPTLCYHPSVKNQRGSGVCRICLVELNKQKLVPACVTPIQEGMEIETNNQETKESARSVLKFLLSRHNLDCPSCDANRHCEFQDLLERYQVTKQDIPEGLAHSDHEMKDMLKDNELVHFENYLNVQSLSSTYSIKIDMDKCIRCSRCIRTCENVQGLGLLSLVGRGQFSHIKLGDPQSVDPLIQANDPKDVQEYLMAHEKCISCGQCSLVCPVGAITALPHVDHVYKLLQDKISGQSEKTIVVQFAPAVRVAISEEFGYEPGRYTTGKLIAGLRKVGFDYVFDTGFSADLTIMEEGTELIERVTKGGPFPMFTSCCPAWVNLVEKYYPELIPNLSSCKSPQQMLGSILKNYWAKKLKLEKENVIVVSIMPCTAKKDEAKRQQLCGDVDFVLTTRELGKLFHRFHIHDLNVFRSSKTDSPVGETTGAGIIFGATGGVMEAALRTAYETVVGKELPKIDFEDVRGLEGIKKAEVKFGDNLTLSVGIAHATANIKTLLERMKSGELNFHFVEMMACPGGCIGGGGEPKLQSPFKTQKELLEKRMKSIYTLDERSKIRKSHQNKQVQQLYENLLEKPLSHKSHELLHTHYDDKSKT